MRQSLIVFGLWLAASLPALTAQVPAPTAVIRSVETRWENIYCDLIEVSRSSPGELTVRFRYRNAGRAALEFPQLINLVSRTSVLEPTELKIYGPLKDEGGHVIGSTTLQGQSGKTIPAGGTAAHWVKLESPPDSIASVTVIVPGAAPFEAVAIGAPGAGVSLLAAPSKPLATAEMESGGMTVEVVEVRRAPGGMLNVLYRYRNGGAVSFKFPNLENQVPKAYVLDPKSRTKYAVARDKGGEPLSSSTLVMASQSGVDLAPGQLFNAWAKFPAPPEAVQKVSVMIDGAPPFENIEIAGTGTGSAGAGTAVAGRITGLDDALKALHADVTTHEIRIALAADVMFDFDKADLKQDAEPVLAKVVTILKAYPGASLSVEGHADAKGNETYNQTLSEKRAANVAHWLAAQANLDAASVHARGWGQSKPIAPNTKPDGSDNPEGRAINRRVEIIVTHT
jgi:outer membrane protein OmpA-like peptidoglycan-associated protein